MHVGFPQIFDEEEEEDTHIYETSPQNVKANENEHQNVLIICAVYAGGGESICVRIETGKRYIRVDIYTSEFSCLWYMSPTNLHQSVLSSVYLDTCVAGFICVHDIRVSHNENSVTRKISLILNRRTFSSLRKIHVRAQLSSKRGDNEPIRYV